MDTSTAIANVDELSRHFQKTWRERQLRRNLDAADFDQLRATGFHLSSVPQEHGGYWSGVSQSTRAICTMLTALGRADSSLALVASMHPSVIAFWTTLPTVDPAFQKDWDDQSARVFASAAQGSWWGTVTSEPGTGGDIMLSKAVAKLAGASGKYTISGAKHFGSGSGMARRMITTAVPEGEAQPDIFIVEMPDEPWSGADGVRMIAPWDGHGMTATQSHSLEFRGIPAERSAWPGHIDKMLGAPRGGVLCMFSAVIIGVIDAAMAEAERKLKPSAKTMNAFDQVEWTRACQEAWLAHQAFEGMLRGMEDPATSSRQTLLGKLSIAELAETIMLRISRVIGGGAFSRNSPFGYWQQDVRALGYLRPPWSLAYDRAFASVSS